MMMSNIAADDLKAQFEAFIRAPSFPCVGAKSALARHHIDMIVAADLRCPADDRRILAALGQVAATYRAEARPFYSLAVIFRQPDDLSELAFEQAMWARLQALADRDEACGAPYDPRVSPDASDPHFSLSFAGEAFFLVGMHPRSSRPARRFMTPVLVFNPHDQFEKLRDDDRYQAIRDTIIARDIALAGSPNPMLAVHGDSSEAAQYSGRAVGPNWRCPFEARTTTPDSKIEDTQE